ncbi:MAG: hypothetical protein ABR903_08735 [Thermodesulfovibrionales bacterium]
MRAIVMQLPTDREESTGQGCRLDFGYTEAFVSSRGKAYGKGLGKILTDFSHKLNTTTSREVPIPKLPCTLRTGR